MILLSRFMLVVWMHFTGLLNSDRPMIMLIWETEDWLAYMRTIENERLVINGNYQV